VRVVLVQVRVGVLVLRRRRVVVLMLLRRLIGRVRSRRAGHRGRRGSGRGRIRSARHGYLLLGSVRGVHDHSVTVRLVSRRMRPSDCRARGSKGEQAGGERAKLVVCGQISLARRVVNESSRVETRRDETRRGDGSGGLGRRGRDWRTGRCSGPTT